MQTLQSNSLLQGGRYKIVESLGQGGFGITYLAVQNGLERKVAVKEFFMKELCGRDESTSHVTLGTEGSRETVNRFRAKFLKEARNIARLNHPNIVRIIDVFEENGTAYYVMEYAENGSLADKVKREGYLSEPVATRYILQVAEALDYIHQQKMNHLDVKPANVMLNEKDESVLIDFGLSKQYDSVTGSQTSTTPVGISEGYAPMEQYKQGGLGEFSPETDIYALGATFFKLLTGITPPSASDVNEDGLPVDELKAKGVSEKAISVITQAMEGRKKDRLKTIRSFIEGLKAPVSAVKQPQNVVVEDDDDTLLTPEKQRVEERKQKIAKNPVIEKSGTEVRSKKSQDSRPYVKRKRKKLKAWLYLFDVVILIVIGVIVYNVLKSNSSSFKASNPAVPITQNEINGHEYVDLGLSVKWATCNVGADKPEDYGGYYAWGETSTKSEYTWGTCFDCLDDDGNRWSVYKVGGKTKIEPNSGHDTARENWGGTWRMPTIEELEELEDKCTWTWISKGGHNGYVVTGPNGNMIFLPAVGCRDDASSGDVGRSGGYWSGTLSSSDSNYAQFLGFNTRIHYTNTYYRRIGFSVRPVTD